ncbi:MAG: TetR/AcrR family transcriptional regulator [Sandaracinus sp.]|nr:TetR/AcrR family transcriptional regulator [Sandaracinus sp.]
MRRRPKQERARQLVDAVVEAAGDVLSKEGAERATTGRIADRAGVSIGSLYQYFPDRAAILARFCERRLEQDIEMMQGILVRAAKGDALAPLVHETAVAMVETYRNDDALYREIGNLFTVVEQTDEVQGGLDRSVQLAAAFLASREDVTESGDPELVALLLIHGLRAALNAVARHAPDKLSDPTLERRLASAALGFMGLSSATPNETVAVDSDETVAVDSDETVAVDSDETVAVDSNETE